MEAENAVAEAPKGTGKIVGKGQIQSFNPNIQLPNQPAQEDTNAPRGTSETDNTQQAANTDTNAAAAATAENTGTQAAAVTETPVAEIKPLTDEELKAEYEKRFPTTAALTDEQKAKQEAAFEKRMLDLYVDGGGKIEEFALLKQVAQTDLTELSKAELTKELKAAGFNETEIAAIQKERYYQLSEDDLEQMEDETEKEFAKRKAEYGKTKLEGKGKMIKENAVDFLDNLKEAVNQKDFFTKRENDISSNVDEHFDKLERKMTLELGKVDDTVIDPVEYEVPQEVIDNAKAKLNTTAARKELLYNQDGSINHVNLAQLVLKAEMFDSAAKTAFLTGGHREVEKFEKIFPKNPNALGVGGNNQANTGKPGKIVSAGQPQRFKPAVNQ